MFLNVTLVLLLVILHVVLGAYYHAVRFCDKIFVPFRRSVTCALECEKTCGLRFRNTPVEFRQIYYCFRECLSVCVHVCLRKNSRKLQI